MASMLRLCACTIILAMSAAPLYARADAGSVQRTCSARTNTTYGFQCQGYATVSPAGLEPVTFIGTVAGSETGIFDGYGTFSASNGSSRLHATGQATFQDKTCFGHIQYKQLAVFPDGSEHDVGLPPLDIDFATVDNGFEILGTPVALPGVTGAGVPRMSCRLVRVRGQD